MSQAIRDRKAYWIGGTLAAFAGVALVRLLAPELAGDLRTVVLAAGYILVVAGITIIAFGTRRKGGEAFIVVEKSPKGRKRR